MAKKQTGTFAKTPRVSFRQVPVAHRDGKTAVKIPLPLINPADPAASIAAQAGACTNCRDATCSSQGCPMGKDIGSANITLAKAGQVANRAFEALKELSRADAEDLIRFCNETMRAEIPDFVTFEDELFSRLSKFDPAMADRLQRQFEGFILEVAEIFDEGGGRGDIYGRACPSKSLLCGSYCQIEFAMARGITIPMHEAAVFDYRRRKGLLKPVTPLSEKRESVAIIGSGAAGTHAALELRRQGYQVTIFERNNQPGELGDGKILAYKVPLDVWRADLEWQKSSGIRFECNSAIGEGGVQMKDLASTFNAIVIATGTPMPRDHGLGGDAADDVLYSNAYLKMAQDLSYRRKFLGQTADNTPPALNAGNKDVVINGHSDTAIDCARLAIAHGALSVTLVSRHGGITARDKGDKSAFKLLVEEAGDKLKFQHWMQATACEKAGNAHILRGISTAAENKGETLELRADMVISAIGNLPGVLQKIFQLQNLPVARSGNIEIQLPALSKKSRMNGILGGFVGRLNGTPVFAGGEVVTGGSLLVTCGKAGIDLAQLIHQYLADPDAFHARAEALSNRPVIDLET